MAVPISNVTRRQVYAPSGSGGAGPYSFTFEILANTDIAVYKDNTLLTLTTHYTVTINANGTGSVTITAAGLALSPTSPTQYAVVGNRTIARTSDFTTGGDFFANTLNDELDQQTIFAQQNAEGLQRALIAPQTDPTTINMTLPAKATRANKTLTFDADGNPTSGVSAADVANAVTYATNAANSATAAASSASSASSSASSASGSASTASTQASNASTSASNASTSASGASTSATNAAASASTASTQASNASTSATNAASSASAASTSASNASSSASAASTSASNAATAQTAAEAARDSALAAYDNFDDRYLGAKSSNPTLDNDGNALLAGALYFNTVVPEMRLWTGSAWVAAYVSGSGFIAATGGTMTGPLNFPDGSAASPSITNDGDTNTGIFFPAADTIAFAEGGAEVARFDSAGNFGLGVTPSAWYSGAGTLQIKNGAVVAFSGIDGSLTTNAYYDTAWKYYGTGAAAQYNQNGGAHKWFNAASGTAGNAITFTQAMTLDSSGKLGIGTTSPIVNLQVGSYGSGNGEIALAASTTGWNSLLFGDGSTGSDYYRGYIQYQHNGDYLVFATAATERARIDSAGMLSVNYTSAISGGLFIVSSNGTKGSLIVKNDDSVQLYSLGTGTVTCSGGVLGFTSDERIKIDDGNYSGGLNAVLNITPKYFYYKNSEGNKDETKGRELGFFAQNIQQTCGLEVVHQPEDPDALLGIHDRGVMAVLVSAIQEQQALITQLTARITALESA